jgi:high affinity Mn2+ porin
VSKYIKTILIACVGVAATSFISVVDCLAAEVAVPSPMPLKAPPAIANYDWSGFYVGGHVGYGRGNGRDTLFDSGPSAADSSSGSLFGGMQFGYNYMLPSRLLFGIEGDISFPNYLDDGIVASRSTPFSSVTEKLDFVSTVRARAGYAFNHWLFYATGGFAWSQARFLEDSNLTGNEDKILRMRTGWALGAGAELAIAPGWTARLEYLYDRLGKTNGTFPSGAGYESTTVDLSSVRVGLNRKLDWTGAATVSGNSSDTWALDPNSWNVHGQLTFIEQGYPAFRSPYQGANSLAGSSQIQNTTSATAFVGYRPWDGTEFYVNPELMQGFGLSNTLGVAGFPNGEAQKSDFPIPRIDIARVFVRQTFGLGGEQETVEDGPNQLAGKEDISRITITAGRFAVLDLFDGNSYSHDPRRFPQLEHVLLRVLRRDHGQDQLHVGCRRRTEPEELGDPWRLFSGADGLQRQHFRHSDPRARRIYRRIGITIFAVRAARQIAPDGMGEHRHYGQLCGGAGHAGLHAELPRHRTDTASARCVRMSAS